MRRLAIVLGFGFLAVSLLPAQTTRRVEFAREVLPILQRSCFECHGPDKQRGKLRLDSKAAAFKGGSGGPVIVAGKASASELFKRISLPKGSDGVMPERGELLTKKQIDIIRAWIDQGADWPDNVQLAKHWAYEKPVRPALPEVKDAAWPRTALDYFILARLEKEGLNPSPEADRATLIRRVYLDLIGLPPSPAEVDAFVADTSPLAYEKLVDRLLASPYFGERWARPWLDLARYADSHGFQKDDFRNTWPYRDWVIKALNSDMPYDRFTIEQLAGDLLPGATLSQKIATGFHRCAPTNVEAGSEPEETRVNQVFDRVNTTAAVWLGTTLECAQCHDHKYDPFTQREYYQLFAFFNSTAIEAERTNPKVPGSIAFLGPYLKITDETSKPAQAAKVNLKKLDQQLAARAKKLTLELAGWEKEAVANLAKAGQVHVLDVDDFRTKSGAPHKELEDKSILLVDDPPDKDTYTVTVRTKLTGITGFKLETLTHPSLPGQGPGRGDADRPNFVLNTFSVTISRLSPKRGGAGGEGDVAPKDLPLTPNAVPLEGERGEAAVKLVRASADFSQAGFAPAMAIDSDPKSAWAIAPKFHQPHWAVFETEKPVGFADGSTLTFTLVQNFGKGRVIGRLRLSALVGTPGAPAVPADLASVLQKPQAKRSAEEKQRLLEYRLEQDEEYRALKEEKSKLESAGARDVTTLVMQELSQPRMSALFKRGDYKVLGEKLAPGVPAVLHPLAAAKEKDSTVNRLALAKWLVDRENPLTARVTVNRWWAEIFGQGIVSTVEDFGIKGEAPTHPELLDWLALEFMGSADAVAGNPPSAIPNPKGSPWSMKHILREIVLSATYRQASKLTPELREKDPQNKLYGRGPRFRMDAEMIRDNALAAAGLLSLKQFGPPIRPYQPDGLWNRIGGMRVEYVVSPEGDRYRRGIYVVWKRSVLYPSFVNFDAGARYACTVKRSRSNTPLQALTLLNDPVYVEAALALAKRIISEKPGADPEVRIRHAIRLCLIRPARDFDVETLQRLFLAQREAARTNPNGTRALLGSMSLPAGSSLEDFAGWYAVATALLNLDETITKQ